jgi:2-polyprenyl-3-methyl-5-hydroxy-6-metoxy-1,4-benzoquinol methylase
MWDETYATDTYVYGEQANQFLQDHAHHLPKGKVICLAEGEGRNAVFLAKMGYSVTAVDLSKVGLEKAQKLAEKHHVKIDFIHGDLSTFELGKCQWDAVVSIFCHLPESVRQSLHSRIITSLKPNGVYLVEGYTPEQLRYHTGGPSKSDMMLSKAILTSELSALDFIHLQELERKVIEGTKHTGLAHVVQAIAKN